MKKAIVSTIRNLDNNFQFWINYHLQYFDRIYLFVDAPEEFFNNPYLLFLRQDVDRVHVEIGCQEQRYNGGSALIHRQKININIAIDYCLNEEIIWLLHIDSDELFYENDAEIWRSDQVGLITFTNHEMAHTTLNEQNCFLECKYFKLNGIDQGWDYERYRYRFLAYKKGKSAVKINPNVQAGIHLFHNYQQNHIKVSNSCILHFVDPTYSHWFNRYNLLGNFDNYWFNDPKRPIRLKFSLLSRDLFQKCLNKGDWREAENFYSRLFLPAEEVERLVRIGNLKKIDISIPHQE